MFIPDQNLEGPALFVAFADAVSNYGEYLEHFKPDTFVYARDGGGVELFAKELGSCPIVFFNGFLDLSHLSFTSDGDKIETQDRINFLVDVCQRLTEFDEVDWDVMTREVFPKLIKVYRWDALAENSRYGHSNAGYREGDFVHSLGALVIAIDVFRKITHEYIQNEEDVSRYKQLQVALARMVLLHDWGEIVTGDTSQLNPGHSNRDKSDEVRLLGEYIDQLPFTEGFKTESKFLVGLFEGTNIPATPENNLIKWIAKFADKYSGTYVYFKLSTKFVSRNHGTNVLDLAGFNIGTSGLSWETVTKSFDELGKTSHSLMDSVKGMGFIDQGYLSSLYTLFSSEYIANLLGYIPPPPPTPITPHDPNDGNYYRDNSVFSDL
ncbi:MAG: hypothetical protein WCO33_00945 [bacterium]